MYGESGYHGAYAAGQSEPGNGMHKSPSGSLYQGRFGQASFHTDDQHTADDSSNSTGMPATHTDAEASAYQGRFGTMPEAKLFEPQYSGELERKGSAYHGKFSQ